MQTGALAAGSVGVISVGKATSFEVALMLCKNTYCVYVVTLLVEGNTNYIIQINK